MDRLVKGGLVLIVLGGNDFVNNYYLVPYSLRSLRYSLPDYVRLIISEYKKILMVICLGFSFSSFPLVMPCRLITDNP